MEDLMKESMLEKNMKIFNKISSQQKASYLQ